TARGRPPSPPPGRRSPTKQPGTPPADSTSTARGDAVAINASGLDVDVSGAKAQTSHETEAHVNKQAELTFTNGSALSLGATSHGTAKSGEVGINLAGLDVKVVSPHAEAGGATRVFVGEGAGLSAAGLSATADATNAATTSVHLFGVSGLDVLVVRSHAEVTHTSEAYVGPRAGAAPDAGLAGSINVGGGAVSLNPGPPTAAGGNQFSFSGGGFHVATVRPRAIPGGKTLAHLGGNFAIPAGAVNATATAPDSSASSDSFSLDLGG